MRPEKSVLLLAAPGVVPVEALPVDAVDCVDDAVALDDLLRFFHAESPPMLFAGVAMVPKPPRMTGDLIFLMGSGMMSGSLSEDEGIVVIEWYDGQSLKLEIL